MKSTPSHVLDGAPMAAQPPPRWSAHVLRAALTVFLFGYWPVLGHAAVQVLYEPQDAADDMLGQDLWKYVYRVSGYAFAPGDNFLRILFPSEYYGRIIENDIQAPDGWTVFVLPADPEVVDDSFNAEGYSNAQTELLFIVPFEWSGGGTPGAQLFQVFEFRPDLEAYVPTVEGLTASAPIPEPETALLLCAGLLLLGVLCRRPCGSAQQ
jgi:hypothetical protein